MINIQPCFYHDISLEIPLDFQKVVRYLYYLWMIYCASLAVNVLGNMTFWIVASKQEEDSDAKANAPKVSIDWFFVDISFSRTNSNGTYRHEK